MRQPLWIINCGLIALFFLGICVTTFLQPKIPKRESIATTRNLNRPKNVTPVNLKSIYEDDIFKTHITESQDFDDANTVVGIPQPPQYTAGGAYQSDTPLFLEPLPITVTGIMVFEDEANNRTVIQDNRDKVEKSYLAGDDLEDAQIVRILRNKVIIIRSNSQQETLFLREQDAIIELETIEPNWQYMIKPLEKNKYQIEVKEFTSEIKTLGRLIDLLNIITAYRDGISTGAKIGSGVVNSLSNALGLNKGDVVLSVNNINVSSTSDRLKAYKQTIDPATQNIVIKLLRQNKEITLEYILNKQKKLIQKTIYPDKVKQHVENKKLKFAKIANKAREQDKVNITKFKNKISQSVSG
jgi:type II secretory pathway component PulC